jgi:hypothetical protein
LFAWVREERDGGLQKGMIDAGFARPGFPSVYSGREGIILGSSAEAGSVLLRFRPPSGVLTQLFGFPAECYPASEGPLTVLCGQPSFLFGRRRWYSEVGAEIAPLGSYLPLFDSNLAQLPLVALGVELLDGGGGSSDYAYRADLLALAGGELRSVARIGNDVIPYTARVARLQGRLVVASWAENYLAGVCPTCQVESFSAQYICLP